MPNRFASGKYSIAMCDRCGQQFKLKTLRKLTIKTQQVDILVCNECWEPDQPQLSLGLYPVNDPQAVRGPRPDTSYITSGVNTLGSPEGGSRIIQWGFNPVGGARGDDAGLTPNNLAPEGQVGIVTIQTS
jgi:hypothetical protein